ncbi:MAG: alpha/beta fold hydrolase [Hydrogeniiclostridium mannosilyticum]
MDVLHREISFESCVENERIFVRIVEPADRFQIRGILQIAHGILATVALLCRYVEQAAVAVMTISLRKSVSSGGSYGYFGEGGCRNLVEDMHKLSHLLQEEYSEKPLILMGHSMGSFLARSYCAKYGNELAGAVFMGTCGNPGKAVLSVERAVAEGKIRRLGKKAHDPLFAKLSTERFNHYFAPVQTPNDWVTSDLGEAKRYTEDPLCGFDLTVSAYRDILDLQAEISAPEWFERVPKELNIFLLAGQKDPVGNFGKGVRWVAEKLKKTGHQVRWCYILRCAMLW